MVNVLLNYVMNYTTLPLCTDEYWTSIDRTVYEFYNFCTLFLISAEFKSKPFDLKKLLENYDVNEKEIILFP